MLISKAWIKSRLILCGIYFSKIPLLTSDQLIAKIEDQFIRNANGVLHIGAHLGQERQRYFESGIKVIWIEAIPEVYEKLQTNISRYPNQTAMNALLGYKNNVSVGFNLSSNELASYSNNGFGSELGFDKLHMVSQITLPMKRLDDFFTTQTLADYDHWVIDVQGAELLVLLGSGSLLEICNSLLVEVSTRQVYQSGATWGEIQNYLHRFGLVPLYSPDASSHENILFYPCAKVA